MFTGVPAVSVLYRTQSCASLRAGRPAAPRRQARVYVRCRTQQRSGGLHSEPSNGVRRSALEPVTAAKNPVENHLLGALSGDEQARVFPQLELVKVRLGAALYESGSQLAHVYFPVDSIVSLLYVMEDGASAEIAVVGNEGVVGIALFMGAKRRRTGRSCRAQAARIAWAPAPAAGVPPAAGHAAPAAALYAGAADADGADGGLQPSPRGRQAAVPLAAAEPRPAARQRADHDAGTHCQHARRSARRGHRGSGQAAGCGDHPLPPRPRYRH